MEFRRVLFRSRGRRGIEHDASGISGHATRQAGTVRRAHAHEVRHAVLECQSVYRDAPQGVAHRASLIYIVYRNAHGLAPAAHVLAAARRADAVLVPCDHALSVGSTCVEDKATAVVRPATLYRVLVACRRIIGER